MRVYIRDTTTWKLVAWQSKALLPIVMRKLDRAGILDLGADGLDGLAAVTEMPIEFVRAGMNGTDTSPGLLTRGVFVLGADGRLVMPNFIDAQEAAASPRLRAELHRERVRARDDSLGRETNRDDPSREHGESLTKRDGDEEQPPSPAQLGSPESESSGAGKASNFVTKRDDSSRVPSGSVTKRDDSSREQTARHEPSQVVTPCRADLISDSSVPDSGPAVPDRVREVYDHWLSGWRRVVRGSNPPKLSEPRRAKIRARLAEGYTVEQIKQAVDALWSSSYHVEGRFYDLELVCRNSTKLDAFLAKSEAATPRAIAKEVVAMGTKDTLSAMDRLAARSVDA